MLHAYVPSHGAGAEQTVHALLRHLVRVGHQVDVILSRVDPAVREDYAIDGVRVHPHTGKTQTPLWLASPPTRPHVIVCHLENTPRAAVLGTMFRIPVVQILHNHLQETLHSTLRHPFALLVANSDWMLRAYQAFWAEQGRSGAPPIIRVHPPVDPAEYATKHGSHVTLMNLTVPKGAHLFYALATRLPECKFLGVMGAYGVQVVRDEAPNVTVSPHVPTTDVVSRIYARTKVLLVPSDYESYGRVAAEAICSGIPVIAHPTEGLRECLGEHGIFCHRDDPDAWVAALRHLHTPRGWSAASRAVLARAADLDPTDDLQRWRTAIEEVADVRAVAPAVAAAGFAR